jgi:hypothetical protein
MTPPLISDCVSETHRGLHKDSIAVSAVNLPVMQTPSRSMPVLAPDPVFCCWCSRIVLGGADHLKRYCIPFTDHDRSQRGFLIRVPGCGTDPLYVKLPPFKGRRGQYRLEWETNRS